MFSVNGRPRNHQLLKETAQEPLKRQNFSIKNPFLGTHPLTNDKLKKLYQENPAFAISTSIDPSCFHEYSNSNDSLTDSSSETAELLTSVYDPTAINLSNKELKICCMKNIKMHLHKINLVI